MTDYRESPEIDDPIVAETEQAGAEDNCGCPCHVAEDSSAVPARAERLPAAALYERLSQAGWRQFAVQRVSDADIEAAKVPDRVEFFLRNGLETTIGSTLTGGLGYAAAAIAMPPLAVAGAGLAMLAAAGFTLERVMHIGQEILAMRSDTPRYSPAEADAHEYNRALTARQQKQQAAAQQVRKALPQLANGDAATDRALVAAARMRVVDINREGLSQLLFEELDQRFRDDIKSAQLDDKFDLAQSYSEQYKTFREKTRYGADSMTYYGVTPTGMPMMVPMR